MEIVESYIVPANSGEGLYREKGSKFLSFAHPVTEMHEIDAFLEEYRKKYFDSRHVCFAYRLGHDGAETKAFDGGEPFYSAGMPILNEIRAKEFTYCIVIVVRYFGGTKLGVPGLVNAYGQAAAEALAHCKPKTIHVTKALKIHYPYSLTAEVTKIMNQNNLKASESIFMEDCRQTLEIPVKEYEKLYPVFDLLGVIVKED
jgi:uncharacterized YigZ family protein